MSAIFDEHTQFLDSGGNPLVGGFVYIGDQGADPVLNPKAIFSDRGLTAALANPQTLDSLGRATNKIWTDGRYSIRVTDLDLTQIYQELDNGEDTGAVTLTLTNVLGTNAITAEASPTITSLDDNAEFIFQVLLENTTDAITLNIDSLGAKAIKRDFDLDPGIGRFKVSQKVKVIYNSTNDNFELVNDNRSVILANKGADIASAGTVDLAAATGNQVDITGTTTITSFGTVAAGAKFTLTLVGAVAITYNATSMILPGNVSQTFAAGDVIEVLSLGSGNWILTNHTPHGYNVPGADGTAGQIQTTDGAGQVAWTGGMVLLEEASASASATIDFTAIDSDTYDHLVLVGHNVIPATDDSELWCRLGHGATPTWLSGTEYHYNTLYQQDAAVTVVGRAEAAVAQFPLNASATIRACGSGTDEAFHFELHIMGASNATDNPGAWHTAGHIAANALSTHIRGAGMLNGVNAKLTAVRFLFDSGNIASGEFKLYGVN